LNAAVKNVDGIDSGMRTVIDLVAQKA